MTYSYFIDLPVVCLIYYFDFMSDFLSLIEVNVEDACGISDLYRYKMPPTPFENMKYVDIPGTRCPRLYSTQ